MESDEVRDWKSWRYCDLSSRARSAFQCDLAIDIETPCGWSPQVTANSHRLWGLADRDVVPGLCRIVLDSLQPTPSNSCYTYFYCDQTSSAPAPSSKRERCVRIIRRPLSKSSNGFAGFMRGLRADSTQLESPPSARPSPNHSHILVLRYNLQPSSRVAAAACNVLVQAQLPITRLFSNSSRRKS